MCKLVVNANIKDNSIWIDGSLDNGIVAHEYGHGISNRNTGSGSSCLNTSAIMSKWAKDGQISLL